jgi:hypothetical protein
VNGHCARRVVNADIHVTLPRSAKTLGSNAGNDVPKTHHFYVVNVRLGVDGATTDQDATCNERGYSWITSWQRSETRTEYSKHGDRLIVPHVAIEDAWA